MLSNDMYISHIYDDVICEASWQFDSPIAGFALWTCSCLEAWRVTTLLRFLTSVGISAGPLILVTLLQ
ncbi:hypothetical protein ACET3Z_030131 [Daucus carota]